MVDEADQLDGYVLPPVTSLPPRNLTRPIRPTPRPENGRDEIHERRHMADRPRLLLVGHDASRSGAPVTLLRLLRWLRAGDHADVSVVLDRPGPLLADYRRLAATQVLDGRVAALVAGVGRSLDIMESVPTGVVTSVEPARLVRQRRHVVADVVLANSLASLSTAVSITPPRTRLVCWVHELDHVAERVCPRRAALRAAALERVDHFLAAGPAVERMLVRRWGIPPEAVSVVGPLLESTDEFDSSSGAVRRHLGVDGPIVMAVGASTRRKGCRPVRRPRGQPRRPPVTADSGVARGASE